MSRVLTDKERQALDRMTLDHASFHIKAELGTGVGTKTIEGLLSLGLIEAGPNARHYGQIGWRLTPDGWRCMYGKTIEEIMALEGSRCTRFGSGAGRPRLRRASISAPEVPQTPQVPQAPNSKSAF